MSQTFNLEKFVADRKDIIDRLYAQADIEIKSFDDLLKLPVNEAYSEMQLKKQLREKSQNNTKEGDGPE